MNTADQILREARMELENSSGKDIKTRIDVHKRIEATLNRMAMNLPGITSSEEYKRVAMLLKEQQYYVKWK